jgi:eukaryotic-like serine/threonine-protein kinase
MGGFQRFCTRCGHELRPGGRFCTGCGHTAAEPTEVSSAPAEPPPVSLSTAETITRGRLEEPFAHPASGPPPQPDLGPPARKADLGPPPQWSDLGPPARKADLGLPPQWSDLGPPARKADLGPPPRWPDPGPPQQPDLAPPRGAAAPAAPRQHRALWLVGAGLAVLLLGGAATAAVLVLHHHASPAAHTGGTSPPGSGPPTTSAPSESPQQQAAKSLSALLAQSVTDRIAIVNAVNDVSECGPSLDHDAQTFQNSATSRQNLLTQLANMPDRSALPSPMLQSLTSAWQASIQADRDFAQWAQYEASQGCTPNDHSDPNYQAAAGPDGQATTDKKAFVSRWNPIAEQYSLPTYQWSQL